MNEKIPPTGLPIPFEQTLPPTKWPEKALHDVMQEAAEAMSKLVDAPIELTSFAVLATVSRGGSVCLNSTSQFISDVTAG